MKDFDWKKTWDKEHSAAFEVAIENADFAALHFKHNGDAKQMFESAADTALAQLPDDKLLYLSALISGLLNAHGDG